MALSKEEVARLQTGDEVYWEDPDEGRCSRVIKLYSIEQVGEAVRIVDIYGDVLECLLEELS